jgi:hypothetical protein
MHTSPRRGESSSVVSIGGVLWEGWFGMQKHSSPAVVNIAASACTKSSKIMDDDH